MMTALLLLAVLAGEDAATLFRAAREAEKRGDLVAAVAKYEQVLALDSSIAEAWANKGLVLYELERHREALQAFEKAARLKPGLVIPQLFRGLEYLRLGEPRKAVAPLEAALKLDPENLKARYALGNARAALEEFPEAISLYGDVLRREPGMEEARYALAIAYLNLSKVTARKLVEAGSPYGKLLLAEYLAASGFGELAEENRREAGKAPGSAADGALYRESLAYRRRAQEFLLEGVRRNPDSFRAHLLLADLARTSADEATARAEYEKAAALAPENAEVQLLLIQFVAPRDEGAALEFALRAVEKLPAHPGLNVELGRLLLKRGAAQEAAGRFRRALEAEPGLAAAHAGVADSLAAAGDLAGAIAEMERAAGQDPDGSWHYRLGRWYRAKGRTEEARAAFAETARIKSAVRARQEASFRKLTEAPGVAAR